MKIGLISDTHSFLDEKVFQYFEPVDEIWHAGDIGDIQVANQLEKFKTFRAVYGNIDGLEIRQKYPEMLIFTIEQVKVLIIHIGGYPSRYAKGIKNLLLEQKPKLFICGHSHILKVMPDPKLDNLLHINPGAAGQQGFHHMRTLVRFDIDSGRMKNLEVIELGMRGR